ncbi:unnamed protein product [marine sediment metagenome]|uniref:SipW-cognate class signal peptide n=1 Tax=marine sediment metagenome TaxID=412755 RepID=X0VHC4_9ZZZZ
MNLRSGGRKVTAVVLVLLVTLAVIGVGYAHWTKTLDIDGTVNTGELDLCWDDTLGNLWCNEVPGEVEGKDVGSVTVGVDPGDCQNAIITLENAYPSYSVQCWLKYKNVGTIPVLIGDAILTCPSELDCVFSDSPGGQIDPPGSPPGADTNTANVDIHVLQPALELATYNVTVEIPHCQWNTGCP